MSKTDKYLSLAVKYLVDAEGFFAIICGILGVAEQVIKAGERYPGIVILVLLGLMIVLSLVAVHVVKKEL